MGDLLDLAGEKHVRLTTFKGDGTAVGAPVWLAPDGDRIVVITGPDTGKVKRLRHTPRVLVAPSDIRGRVKPGAPEYEGVAELVEDPAEAARIAKAVLRRYPVLGRVLPLVERVQRVREPMSVGIRIRPAGLPPS